jgi:nucleotide-binding universal stress UspA family protein
MNWSDQVRLLGAPGPHMADAPHPRVTPAGPNIKPRRAGAIIVGVGGSEHSADGIALADLLAGFLEGPLVLVHNHPHGVPSDSDSAFAAVEELARHPHVARIRITPSASPVEGLQESVGPENAQLIVVGPSLRRMLPGSVGEQLLFGARVPVAIAPPGYANAVPSLRLLASAFDGSPESRRALDWAARLARSSSSRLRVITVHAPTAYGGIGFAAVTMDPAIRDGLEQEQSAAIAAIDGPVEAILSDGDPGRTLVEASQEADILIMGSRGHGRVRAALLGSVSHYVIRHAACPVVILPRGAGREEARLADQEPDLPDVAA